MSTFSGKKLPSVNLLEDNHVHTRLCNHATGEMEDYVKAAVALGLSSITFLEHLEASIHYFERTWLTDEDFTVYLREGERLRQKYRKKISIRLGVETGYNPLAIDQLKSHLALYNWDQIGLSYHFLFDGKRHLNMVSRRQENLVALANIGPEQVITRYFEGLIQGVQELDCHVLCHLDAVMRHHPELTFQSSHWKQVETLLQTMRTKGMQLELNTSGYAVRNTPYPCRRIVQKALELGIPFAAGSDAHRPEQVGRFFDRLPAFLTDSGSSQPLSGG